VEGEAPAFASLLRRSSRFGCEGWKPASAGEGRPAEPVWEGEAPAEPGLASHEGSAGASPSRATARMRRLHCCFTDRVKSIIFRVHCLFQWDRTSAIMTNRGPSHGTFSEGRFSFPSRVRFASVRAPYGKSRRAGRATVGWVWRSNE